MDKKKIEKVIGVTFKDEDLLERAFTHRSYLNEHQNIKKSSNERLEFLGDAVLQFLSSEFLFTNYPNSAEGNLTNFRAALVCTPSLAEESRKLGYGEYLFLSKGEEASGGREREYILANTFEAVLGAIYLESGVEACRKFLTKKLFYKVKGIVESNQYKDFKSSFQELAQSKYNQTPIYKVLQDWGPDHDKKFKIGVYINDKQLGVGEGTSKQRAEQASAKNALENL